MAAANNSTFWQRTPIRSVSLEVKDLQKLFAILTARQSILLERAKKKWVEKNPDKSEAERADVFAAGDDCFQITALIRNRSGEEFHSTDSKIFEDYRSAREIEFVSIDTTIRNRIINGRDLFPHARIDIHLSDPAIFNPSAIMSQGTLNESSIIVAGSDHEWCEKTLQYLSLYINQKRNAHGFIHAKFVYDFLL